MVSLNKDLLGPAIYWGGGLGGGGTLGSHKNSQISQLSRDPHGSKGTTNPTFCVPSSSLTGACTAEPEVDYHLRKNPKDPLVCSKKGISPNQSYSGDGFQTINPTLVSESDEVNTRDFK